MPIRYHDVHLNGTFWPPANPSFSRLEPGPEADAAWHRLEIKSPDVFPISRQDVINLGKDPETVARFPDEDWGMGSDAFVASLDTLHKMHCLNEVRKMSFEDYGEENPTKKRHGELWWIHLRHCVDMLAQDIMCHADADVLTYNWMDTQSHPFPDFNINRKCRDFGALLAWHQERKVDMEKYYRIQPERARLVQAEDEYYDMFGFEGSDLFPGGKGWVRRKPQA